MGGNDGEIYKTTTACADETGIEIVKVREKDVEGRCYQEAYMHAFLWCSKNFAPELLLVGESEHNIYICMKRMEKTLCDWIPTRKVGMIADVLIKFFQTLDSLHKEYGFVHGDMHGENIMLRDNKAVLIDMGFSCREQTRSLKPIWPPLTRFCQNGRKGAPHPPLIRQRSRGWVCGGSHPTSYVPYVVP